MNHTPHTYPAALKSFEKTFQTLGHLRLQSAVGGVPKFKTDSLTFWHTNPAKQDLENILKTPVTLVNDAEIAGIGEAVYGAGKEHGIIAYLTFSTGFGGAKIVNGQVDPNLFGFEPKLQIATYDPKTKKSHALSEFVSGRGIQETYKKNPERIRSKKIWAEVENWMKVAAVNAAVFWSPECVIIGGAVGLNRNISAARIQKFIDNRLGQTTLLPVVKKAKLGQLSGLYGALALIQNKT
jgi:glucokinase